MQSFFKLIRIGNLAIVALTLCLGKFFLIQEFLNIDVLFSVDFVLILIGITLITAAGYIINDYYDLKIDVVNKPEKVQIDRTINRKTALLIHLGINFSAFILGALVHWKILGFLFFLPLLYGFILTN